MLDRVARHLAQEVAPPGAFGWKRLMSHLDPGLAGMTAPAEALEIGQRIGEVGAVSDRLDMIDLCIFASART